MKNNWFFLCKLTYSSMFLLLCWFAPLFFYSTCFAYDAKEGDKKLIIESHDQDEVAQLLIQAEDISNQLKQIEQYIGKQPTSIREITFNDVSLEEIYYSARNLYRRSNRFSFEITGNYVKPLDEVDSTITTSDIGNMLDQSQERIREVIEKFNIQIMPAEKTKIIGSDIGNDSLLNIIRKCNAQLSNMLYYKTMPSNVYSQIYLANQYLMKILNEKNIPLPKYSSEKLSEIKPSDVFQVLLKVLAALNKFSDSENIKMATIADQSTIDLNNITPDDVLGLSELVLAKSKVLYLRCHGGANYSLVNYGYKIPRQVYEKSQLAYLLVETLLANNDQHCVEGSSDAKA